MDVLILLLLIAAAACFFCAMIGVAARRVNLVAAGLLAWVLTVLLPNLAARL